jgi:hypothetical protein
MSDWSHAFTTAIAILAVAAVCTFSIVYMKEGSGVVVGVGIPAMAGLGGYHVARCVDRQRKRDIDQRKAETEIRRDMASAADPSARIRTQ